VNLVNPIAYKLTIVQKLGQDRIERRRRQARPKKTPTASSMFTG
jgi:hypothetical protein